MRDPGYGAVRRRSGGASYGASPQEPAEARERAPVRVSARQRHVRAPTARASAAEPGKAGQRRTARGASAQGPAAARQRRKSTSEGWMILAVAPSAAW